jgi:ribonuclease P protein component
MFQKSNRLRKNDEIMKTIKKGVNIKTPFFNVKYLKTNQNFKVTIIISKKIFKNATDRNRVKRIFRAELRNFLNKENKILDLK